MKGELNRAIQKAAGTYGVDSVMLLACKVDSSDESDRSCMVTPINNNIASFKAYLMCEKDDGVLIIPSNGSTVKVIFSNLNSPMVVQFSEVAKVKYISGDTEFLMQDGAASMFQGEMEVTLTGGKIKIKNGEQDFKTVMGNLFTHLAAMTFTNGAGTTSVANNVSDINSDKTDFNNLFS